MRSSLIVNDAHNVLTPVDILEHASEKHDKLVYLQVLGTLQPREAEILRARYGLQDGKLKTLEEVGEIFDVSLRASTFPCPSLCCLAWCGEH